MRYLLQTELSLLLVKVTQIKQVVSHISAKTGIVWSGSGADDECDAWVLREMMLAKFGFSEYDWSADSMSALDKIDWSRLPCVKE